MPLGVAPAKQRPALYLGACAGLIAFSAALVGSASSLPFAIPWYLPNARAWEFATLPPGPGIAMDYYGRIAVAAAAGILVGTITLVATRGRAVSATVLRAAGVWAVGLTMLGMLWYAWAFAHRTISPPSDLPSASDIDHD